MPLVYKCPKILFRCRTITVDLSTNVSVSYKWQPPREVQEEQLKQQHHAERSNAHPSDRRSDEATAVRLFTSSSEGVSLNFEGLLLSPSQPPSHCGESPATAGAATAAGASAGTYHVPKDWRYEKGDGPRSVSRITVNSAGTGGKCKTLRCDQYGIPLEQVEAAEEGVPWTWEQGMVEDVDAIFNRLHSHYTKQVGVPSG